MEGCTVTAEAVAKWATLSTKASAELERRGVPADFVRSAAVSKFLAERRRRKV